MFLIDIGSSLKKKKKNWILITDWSEGDQFSGTAASTVLAVF